MNKKEEKEESYEYSFCIVKHPEEDTVQYMNNIVKKVIQKTGATSLDWSCTYAGDVIKIKELKDKPLVSSIINAVLEAGNAVYMSQGSGVIFPAYSHHSKRLFDIRLLNNMSYMECMGDQNHFYMKGLSLKASKWKYPGDVREILEEILAVRGIQVGSGKHQGAKNRLYDPLFKEESELLQIQRAKNFMKYVAPTTAWIKNFKALQKKITAKWPDDDIKDSPRPMTIDLTGTTPFPRKKQKTSPPLSPIPEENKDDFFPPPLTECCICFTEPPTTMVLPCRHCVVCQNCSDVLKTDPINSKICVVCRVAITHILDHPH